MKRIVLSVCLLIATKCAFAQITVTSADMPVLNDTLRWSTVLAAGAGINLVDSGANHTWDYSSIVPVAQGLDHYQSAISVNIAWAIINASAYGYKVADSIPTMGALPVTVQNIYNFFKKNGTTSYDAVGFGATISGSPIPAAYSDADEIYFFPLTYGNAQDSSTYFVTASVPLLGTWTQSGYRLTKVDGWGTIKTPYYTTAQNCIRVRSEKVETDSIHILLTSQNIKLPIHQVDYKWLLNGEHYPALWVTATIVTDTVAHTSTENITTIRFKDVYREDLHPNGVNNLMSTVSVLTVHPNPAQDGKVYLDIPASWQGFTVEVYDMTGKLVNSSTNKRELNLEKLPKGEYLGRVSSADNTGIVRITK